MGRNKERQTVKLPFNGKAIELYRPNEGQITVIFMASKAKGDQSRSVVRFFQVLEALVVRPADWERIENGMISGEVNTPDILKLMSALFSYDWPDENSRMPNKSGILAACTSTSRVVVQAAGRSATIEPLPASAWISALAEDEPFTAVFPGLLSDEEEERIAKLMIRGDLDLADVRRMSFSAISAASGFPWWEALSLVGACDTDPRIMGELTLKGVDADKIPFGRWCAAVYSLFLQGMDEKTQQKWLAKFTMPPPEAEAMEEAGSVDSFEDMVRGFRGMPGARG